MGVGTFAVERFWRKSITRRAVVHVLRSLERVAHRQSRVYVIVGSWTRLGSAVLLRQLGSRPGFVRCKPSRGACPPHGKLNFVEMRENRRHQSFLILR